MLTLLDSRGNTALVRLPAERGFSGHDDSAGSDAGGDGRALGAHVWPLSSDWPAVVQAALGLRPLVVRAGDDLCRMAARLPVAADAGLTVDTSRWACGMAVQEQFDDGRLRRGLVFYDGVGRLALRLDLEAGASRRGFEGLVRRFSVDAAPTVASTVASADPRSEHATADRGRGAAAAGAPMLATPVGSDAVLEVLRHAGQAGIAMAVTLACRGVRLHWDGALQALSVRHGCAVVAGLGLELQWSEVSSGLEAQVLRAATSAGLVQTLALQSPAGDTRLLLRPAAIASVGAQPQPCAWRAAIDAAEGGRCGLAC